MSYPRYSAAGMILGSDWDVFVRAVLRFGGASAVVGFASNLSGRENYWYCDGTADDVQINLALTYVNGLGGGSVLLEEGDYDITATLSVPVDVMLLGAGWNTVLNYDAGGNCITITGDNAKVRDLRVIVAAGAGGAGTRPNCIYAAGRTNLEVANVWLYGDRTVIQDGSDIRQCGIIFSTVTYSKIVLCRSDNYRFYGILLYSSSEYNTVSGNTCNGAGRGIRLQDSDNNSVIGNTCFENAHGIDLYDSSDNTIVGNICNENSERGIFMGTNSVHNLVTGNTCNENDRQGIELLGGGYDTITGNMCNNNLWHGIFISTADNNTVGGNVCYQNVRHGILVDSGVDNVVTGNTCNENDVNNTNTYDGICVEDDSDDNIIMSNICNDNDRWGISIGIAANDCVSNWVKDNLLQGNTSGAFSDQGTDTKLATVHCQLTQAVNGAALKDSAWASPNGVDVDAATEGAVGTVWLPPEVQQVVRIIIYGWSNVIEAANNMLLNVYIVGGSSGEQWNAESIDVADVPSEETGGIAANDVLHWVIDATDDANVGDLVGGDLLHCAAVGEGVSAPDIATDAVFGDCIIEYV